MARTDFRAAAARRLSEERELSPAIVSLLSNDRQGRPRGGVRNIDVDRITPNPEQPRLAFDETSLEGARLAWKLLAGREGVERNYWAAEGGRWVKKG